MLRIVDIDAQPLHRLRYLNARPGGGTETQWLAIERATVTGLPAGLDALVVASDLQGVDAATGALLGVAAAEALEPITNSATGVLLAGDLYSVPAANKRGGFGDVSPVWRAFAERFRWVAGVAGNHDDVSQVSGHNVHVLDGDVASLDGLSIGGVGLISGNAAKLGRRSEEEQLALIEGVLAQRPDVLVLHEGPQGDEDQRGHPRVPASAPLTLCGHCHWARPLFTHARGQVLNADARVVVLSRLDSER